MHNTDVMIAAVIFFVIAAFQPLLGLAATIGSIPLPLPKSFFLSQVHLGEIVFALVVAAFLLTTTARGTWQQNKGYDLIKAFVPFALIALISGLWNMRMPYLRVHRVIGQMLIWAELPVAYFVVRNIVKDKKTCMTIFFLCFAILTLFSVAIVVLYTIDPGKVLNPAYRLLGGFDSPNTIASYLSIMFPLGVGLLAIAPRIITKIAIGLPSILVFFLLLKTYSRGAIISLGIGLLAWLLYSIALQKEKKKIAAMVFFILFCAMITIPIVKNSKPVERLYSSISLANARQGRIWLGRHSIALARKHPIVGVGPGNYLFVTKARRVHHRHRRRVLIQPLSPHNLLFKIFAETGVFGLLAFFYFLKCLVANGVACLRALKHDSQLHILGTSLVVTLFIFLLHNMVDVTMRHGIAIQLGIHIGLLNVLCDRRTESVRATKPS
jgi:O-antigen ligase